MFSNSKMSKIDPRGQHFSNKSKSQKSLKYPMGGGGSNLFWKNSKIFPSFTYDASPYNPLQFLKLPCNPLHTLKSPKLPKTPRKNPLKSLRIP